MSETLQEILSPILGTYSPTVTQTITTVTDGTITTTTTAQNIIPDYEYIAGAVMFIIMIYCILRMIGGFLKCKI